MSYYIVANLYVGPRVSEVAVLAALGQDVALSADGFYPHLWKSLDAALSELFKHQARGNHIYSRTETREDGRTSWNIVVPERATFPTLEVAALAQAGMRGSVRHESSLGATALLDGPVVTTLNDCVYQPGTPDPDAGALLLSHNEVVALVGGFLGGTTDGLDQVMRRLTGFLNGSNSQT